VGAAPKPKTNIVPMRALSDREALAWLVQRERTETSTAALARDWRWSTSKVKSRLDRWAAAGEIELKAGLGGRTVIAALSRSDDAAPVGSVPTVVTVVPPVAPPVPPPASGEAPAATAVEETAAPPPAGGEAMPAVVAPKPVSSLPADPAPAAVPVPVQESAVDKSPVHERPKGPEGATADAAAVPATKSAARTATAKVDTSAETAIVRAPSAFVIPAAANPALASPVFAGPVLTAPVAHPRGSGFISFLAYLVAVALAGIAAYFSITGMIVLFPGAPTAIVVMGVVMETAKLITVAFLAHQWRLLGWLSRLVLVTLVFGLASINAAGVYSQLVAAHFGDLAATSAVETEAAALAAKTELQTQTIADLDRRVAQIDGVIAEMTKRGRTSGALEAINTQRKTREGLVGQRHHEAETLAAIKSEAGAVAARTRQMEIEAAPIMYVAQMMGATTEQAIRMLILLMVLTCDPLAVALTAVASRPRRTS
jgi:hypothetical protein